VIEGTANVTTPLSVASSISNSLAKAVLVATVKFPDDPATEVPYDLRRPLTRDCQLQLHKFDSKEGKRAFWHSSAHIMGSALEQFYGDIALDDGPALAEGSSTGGFFYDFKPGSKGTVSNKDFEAIVKLAQKLVEVCSLALHVFFALAPVVMACLRSGEARIQIY